MPKGRIPCATLVRDYLLVVGCEPTYNRVLVGLSLFAQPDGTQIKPGVDSLYRLTGVKVAKGKLKNAIEFWIAWGILHRVGPAKPGVHGEEYRIDAARLAYFLDKESVTPSSPSSPPHSVPPSSPSPRPNRSANSVPPASPSAESRLGDHPHSTRLPIDSNSVTQRPELGDTGGNGKENLRKQPFLKPEAEAEKETATAKHAAPAGIKIDEGFESQNPADEDRDWVIQNSDRIKAAFKFLEKNDAPFGSLAFQRVFVEKLDTSGYIHDGDRSGDVWSLGRRFKKALEERNDREREIARSQLARELIAAMEATIQACRLSHIAVPPPFFFEKRFAEHYSGIENTPPRRNYPGMSTYEEGVARLRKNAETLARERLDFDFRSFFEKKEPVTETLSSEIIDVKVVEPEQPAAPAQPSPQPAKTPMTAEEKEVLRAEFKKELDAALKSVSAQTRPGPGNAKTGKVF